MKLSTRAHSFDICYCEDPNCGPHIVAFDTEGLQICEIVMSPLQALAAIQNIQNALYKKITQRV